MHPFDLLPCSQLVKKNRLRSHELCPSLRDGGNAVSIDLDRDETLQHFYGNDEVIVFLDLNDHAFQPAQGTILHLDRLAGGDRWPWPVFHAGGDNTFYGRDFALRNGYRHTPKPDNGHDTGYHQKR